MTYEVSIKPIPERRPFCCPDPQKCVPIHISPFFVNKELTAGYSASCYGYCSEKRFIYDQVEHVNDISHCVITPLKGVIRFFNNIDDFFLDLWDIKSVLKLLRQPKICSECQADELRADIVTYIDETILCNLCAVRIGRLHYNAATKLYESKTPEGLEPP